MVVVKIMNHKVCQAAFGALSSGSHQGPPAAQILNSFILITRYPKSKQNAIFFRQLVQSTRNSQKVTVANNQQIIPISRNIFFRECDLSIKESKLNGSFSSPVSAASLVDLESAILDGNKFNSPIEGLKKRAKGAVEKKDSTPAKKYYGQDFNLTSTEARERKLVVLLSWLDAKERYIEKYRQFYLDRGFDVLNVKTSPLDLILPSIGGQKIAKDFVRFMIEKEYSNVVLHAFSVGGFMFGRTIIDIEKESPKTRDRLMQSIKGCIFDSVAPYECLQVGVAKSLTKNKTLHKFIENCLSVYLKVAHNIATKYYLEANDKFWGGPVRSPCLFIMSKDDIVSEFSIVDRLVKTWQSLGIKTKQVIFESSPHVQAFAKHHEVYRENVDKFLKELKLP